MQLYELIDKFHDPVLIVDEDGRVVATNKTIENIIGRGKSYKDYAGLLAGEVMECVYASLPEGCGKTEHCIACDIRKTIMATMEDGKPRDKVPVKLHRKDEEIKLFISTQKIMKLVRVVVEREPI